MKKKETISQREFNTLARRIVRHSGPPTICFSNAASKKRFLIRARMMEIATEMDDLIKRLKALER